LAVIQNIDKNPKKWANKALKPTIFRAASLCGKWRLSLIDISIRNTRVTPTISAQARQKKLHRVDRLKVEGKNIKLLATGYLTDRFLHFFSFWATKKQFDPY